MICASLLTQERLRSLLDYSPETGKFKWLVRRSNIAAGVAAGTLMCNGYLCIRVDKRLHLAHRLAWLWVTGDAPLLQVDHINGDRADNRFCNLRLATNSQNQQNRRAAQASSSTGLMGVLNVSRLRGYPKPFKAAIKKNGRLTTLGYFETAEEAHAAYLAAKRVVHEFCTI